MKNIIIHLSFLRNCESYHFKSFSLVLKVIIGYQRKNLTGVVDIPKVQKFMHYESVSSNDTEVKKRKLKFAVIKDDGLLRKSYRAL